MADLPTRQIRDPRMLRALAHPIRLRLVDELVLDGPATATELAEKVGESPANCSWHLRQLAKYGFIEESTGGMGRNRPWRFVPIGNRWGDPEDSPELARAGAELTTTLLDQELTVRNGWENRQADEPEQWRRAAFTHQSIAWLTAEELAELHESITALFIRHMERLAEPGERPAGARPVRLVAWGVPAR